MRWIIDVDSKLLVPASFSQETGHYCISRLNWAPNMRVKFHLWVFLCKVINGLWLVLHRFVLGCNLFWDLACIRLNRRENNDHLPDISYVAWFISVHEASMLCPYLTHLEGRKLLVVLPTIIERELVVLVVSSELTNTHVRFS